MIGQKRTAASSSFLSPKRPAIAKFLFYKLELVLAKKNGNSLKFVRALFMISAIELFQISLLTQLREAKLHDYQVILYIRFQLADHCFIKTSHNPIPTIM